MTRIYDIEVHIVVDQYLTMEIEADNETEARAFAAADIEKYKYRLKDIGDVHTSDVNMIEIEEIVDKTAEVNEKLGIKQDS
jgi:D-hexose-6-phosphate mutarotase